MLFKNIPTRQRGVITRGIRQAYTRSDQYKVKLIQGRVEKPRYKKDGSSSKKPHVFYQCEICNTLAKSTDIQLDHIEPVIPLNKTLASMTLNEYADRVFNLPVQRACTTCHKTKSKAENSQRRKLNK